ncbi:MAG: tyrosine-type recombinase/integrase [Betaproteobacteria bacterium]|nr:tyrosine-type recombinase/integrase [Betaproteobacteria bacterium]
MLKSIDTYLNIRRAAGFKLKKTQTYLASYARFASGDIHVRAETAIRWAGLGRTESTRAVRLQELVRFARFAHTEDELNEVPSSDVFRHRRHRRLPYLFSAAEIIRIVGQAQRLGPSGSLRPHTYSTLFGLLAATGMRISEALSLRLCDITPDGLVIRETKFRKSRLVCLHPSVVDAIDEYLTLRTRVAGADDHLFISHRGKHPLHYPIACETFKTVLKAAKISAPAGRPQPRLHDLRHTFAVNALQACSVARDRADQHMLALSTYLGHAHVASTYWYLDSTPQLMRDIADACDTYLQGDAP